MGIGSYLKGSKAIKLQKKGQKEEAIRLYEEAFAGGLNDPRFLLPYALLIIRDGQFQKAKDFLVEHQKAPGMMPQQRVELMVYYAVCCFRLGQVDKGVSTLEQQFRKTETGLIYQTLGYLYVEQLDQARYPDLDYAAILAGAWQAPAEPAEVEETTVENGTEPDADPDADAAHDSESDPRPETKATPGDPKAAEKAPEEIWDEGRKKAEAFIQKSLEYDDEDAICLDNMGQFVYRVLGDKDAAKPWFDKAIALKPQQIDTLWFQSRYDLEAGNTQGALEKLKEAAEGRFSPLNYCNKEKVTAEIDRLKGEAQA
ncbi:MAG: hypothetical protein IJK06_09935 [Clostridia bacterium]|nr:hypothetical protein [Clostridia bacterium]